jgi:23S rRNA (uracil1939-C5)-methyltransferase
VKEIEIVPAGVAVGGDAVGRDADGKVVFVAGAVPGERVLAAVTEDKRDYARAVTIAVLEPSADRVAPPCPAVAAGCGGCGWQHINVAAQRRHKATMVTDALRRIGHVEPPPIDPGPDLATTAFRTTVRCVVVDGRAGYRRARSHDGLAVDGCLVAHPLLDDLIRRGDFGTATEVTLRAGAATGERLVVAAPTAADVRVPDDVRVVGADELRRGGRGAAVHEDIGGRRWRISARSFFQTRPDGAAALVELVRAAAGDIVASGGVLADLCCGVGLFSGALLGGVASPAKAVGVERQRSAARDAMHNLRDLPVRVAVADVERWRPVPSDVVVADPARGGLGRKAVEVVVATGASRLVLVSCDAASLGRDAGLLATHGYGLQTVTMVDLFPHTPRVEVVSVFDRGSSRGDTGAEGPAGA